MKTKEPKQRQERWFVWTNADCDKATLIRAKNKQDARNKAIRELTVGGEYPMTHDDAVACFRDGADTIREAEARVL